MAFDIPLPKAPGMALAEGIDAGGDLFQRMMLSNYYNQLRPSGDVANAIYVENLRRQFGENDPRYMQAKRAHEMMLANRESLMGYRDIMGQTAPYRATTTLGRTIAEGRGQGALDRMSSPKDRTPRLQASMTGDQLYDEEGNPIYVDDAGSAIDPEKAEAYERAIAKQTSDPAIRGQIPFAKNVEITLDAINPDALFQYSGVKGHLKLGKDMLQAAVSGKPSDDLLSYSDEVVKASQGAKQMRQFWKDSIQPAAREAIEALVNPSTWYKDPKVAARQFETVKKLTKQELKTFTEAGTSPVKLGYNKKTGDFFAEKSPEGKAGRGSAPTQKDQSSLQDVASQLSQQDRNLAELVSKSLIEILPEATPENIIQTHLETGESIQSIADHLNQYANQQRGRR